MMIQTLAGPLIASTSAPTKNDLDEICALPNPPLVKLTLDDVHVRRCRSGHPGPFYGGAVR